MTRTRSSWIAMTAVLLLAGGLSGCAGDEAAPASPPPSATTEAGGENADESGGGESMDVTATGEGPIGLTAGEVPDGEGTTVSGKLIVGPGGCLSFVDDDRPQLLVFDADAEFVLRDDQPSVTADASGTIRVGEQFDLSVIAVPAADTIGIPDRCAEGAADTVLAVAG